MRMEKKGRVKSHLEESLIHVYQKLLSPPLHYKLLEEKIFAYFFPLIYSKLPVHWDWKGKAKKKEDSDNGTLGMLCL